MKNIFVESKMKLLEGQEKSFIDQQVKRFTPDQLKKIEELTNEYNINNFGFEVGVCTFGEKGVFHPYVITNKNEDPIVIQRGGGNIYSNAPHTFRKMGIVEGLPQTSESPILNYMTETILNLTKKILFEDFKYNRQIRSILKEQKDFSIDDKELTKLIKTHILEHMMKETFLGDDSVWKQIMSQFEELKESFNDINFDTNYLKDLKDIMIDLEKISNLLFMSKMEDKDKYVDSNMLESIKTHFKDLQKRLKELQEIESMVLEPLERKSVILAKKRDIDFTIKMIDDYFDKLSEQLLTEQDETITLDIMEMVKKDFQDKYNVSPKIMSQTIDGKPLLIASTPTPITKSPNTKEYVVRVYDSEGKSTNGGFTLNRPEQITDTEIIEFVTKNRK